MPMRAPYTPARFTEAARTPGVFHDEHMHGAVRHSHPHLHDDSDEQDGEANAYITTQLHGHTHCRMCGSDDRVCGHHAHRKSGK